MVISRVVRSLGQITAAMGSCRRRDIGRHSLHKTSDEMGSIASRAAGVQGKRGQGARHAGRAGSARKDRAARRGWPRCARLADAFEGAVGEIVETVSSASTQLEFSAGTLYNTAERAQELTTIVAAASEQASTNVQTVASATEEMSSSVTEIGRQVQESARSPARPSRRPQDQPSVGELSERAKRIGDVVELINTLPARPTCWRSTPPSRRRGPARPARASRWSPEVKALAEQTAKATEEIGSRSPGSRRQPRTWWGDQGDRRPSADRRDQRDHRLGGRRAGRGDAGDRPQRPAGGARARRCRDQYRRRPSRRR